MTKKTGQQIREFSESINMPTMWEYVNTQEFNQCENTEDLREELEEGGYFNQDIVYYSNAIKYLADNDPSFTRAFTLATELGYDMRNLNSEILATLVHSDDLYEQWNINEEKIQEFIDS